MDKHTLLGELSIVMEVDLNDLNDEFNLKERGLDSLTTVSAIAAIDIIYGVKVLGIELEKCEKIKDIFELIKTKMRSL